MQEGPKLQTHPSRRTGYLTNSQSLHRVQGSSSTLLGRVAIPQRRARPWRRSSARRWHACSWTGSRRSSRWPVAPSGEYLRELHACWRDTTALSRHASDERALAPLQDAAKFGLARMPSIEPASGPHSFARGLIEARCRVTDNLLPEAHDAAAHKGRVGNFLSQLTLAPRPSNDLRTTPALIHAGRVIQGQLTLLV